MNTKLQINLNTRIQPESQKVLEYSVLANVAANTIDELSELYSQMKNVLGKEVVITGLLQQPYTPTPVQLPAAPPRQEEDLGLCPNCSAPLKRIVCKKYGSKNYGKQYAVCPRHRTTGCSHIQELAS